MSKSSSSSSVPPSESVLVGSLKLATDKPLVHRSAGLAALTTLLTSHWSNLTTHAEGRKFVLPIVRDPQTFLNHFAAVTETNIAAYLPCYRALFTQHAQWLQKEKIDQPQCALYVTIVKLMTHPSHVIRRAVVGLIGSLLRDPLVPSGLNSRLLRTFHLLLYSKSTGAGLPVLPNGTAASFVWSRVLLTIASRVEPVDMPLALWIAADPILSNNDARSPINAHTNFEKLITAWSYMLASSSSESNSKQLPRAVRRAAVITIIRSQLPAIEAMVLSDRGLLQAQTALFVHTMTPIASSAPAAAAAAAALGAGVGDLDSSARNIRQRQTTVSFLVGLFRLEPIIATRLLPKLYGLLAHPAFDRITAESIAIFHSGDSLVEFVAEGEFRPVAGENKNVKRDKDWTEKDEQLEQAALARAAAATAAAAATKKPAVGARGPAGKGPMKIVPLTGQAKIDSEQAKKLADQSVLRSKLVEAKNSVEPILDLFALLAVREPELIHAEVGVLIPKLHQLMNENIIVRDAAIRTHRACIQCLDSHVRLIGVRLSLSIEALVIHRDVAFIESHGVIAHTLRLLCAAAKRKSFSPNTFGYIFPIVRHTILASADPLVADATELVVDEEEEHEFKPHIGGARTVQRDADGDAEGEDDADDAAADAIDESKEEKSSDHAPIVATVDSINDSDATLSSGLQLGLVEANHVLHLHCTSIMHGGGQTNEPRFPVALMFSALLHALNAIGMMHSSTLTALIRLARSSVTSAEILPLLGLTGVLSPNQLVRVNSIQALNELRCFSPAAAAAATVAVGDRDSAQFTLFTQRAWIACHDAHAEVSGPAAMMWTKFSLALSEAYLPGLIQLLTCEAVQIRTAVGTSIASAIQLYPDACAATLHSLTSLFISSPDQVVSSNLLGLRQGAEFISRASTRSGVAHSIGSCTDSLASTDVLRELFAFFIEHGLRDTNDQVWEDVLHAVVRVINHHGREHMSILLPQLESALVHDSVSTADRLREGIVVSMGTLARHMSPDDPTVLHVVDSLIDALRTPAHSVQKAVAECIAPLMHFTLVNAQAGKWIDLLLLRVHTSEDYGERKGAAFGLAGMVKGLKLASLKKYSILDQLAVMVQDKSSARARQGALFAYERLFFELGNRFEPYVVHILPHLLACYGDSNNEVREATQEAAKMIMSHLTGHGIKMVLPLVLRALEDKAWRTKLESIGLLSAMAYCSPTQLSACLPMIVPRLLEVNADANAKVQVASRAALKQIGSVIKNPEILTLVPVLLAALNDPTVHTKRALQDLMRTSFVHSVDPPSLALIIPILRKGLKGRTAITKKMSAQVVGSMCSLIGDVKDILPYASTLLKYLKLVLVDPNPEVRAVAARALAALYKGIVAEEVEGFIDLREWLLQILRSDDTTPTIRSGCAQGLAQLLAVQGLEPTSQLLPTLFTETKSDRAVVREGFFNLFGFLPEAFQQIFSIFVADVLPVIVEGLADEIGLVREAALAAGQSLVLNFAQSKTDLLLPALEDGIIASDWRIRLSSVQLLGVMLLRLAGVSVKMIVGANNHTEDGEDDGKSAATICTREQENHIESVLGTERRNRLISTVYLMRCDVMPAVADIAFRCWKSIVSNSPRMLTTILPVLMSLIISDLASTKEERQIAAGRTLGELVQKMGDYILAEIVPILQSRLSSDDKYTRQGVCLGLSEVMASSRKNDLASYMADLVPSVRDALCDNEELVRKAAGTCFHTLLRNLGKRAVDDVIPALLWTLDDEIGDEFKSQLVLEGIKVVLSINSSDVLPYLVPALAKTPLSLYHAKALAFLSTNFAKGFIRYVDPVTHALLDGIGRCAPADLESMRIACSQVVLCVTQDCVHQFVNVLEETSNTTRTTSIKMAVAHLIASFTANTRTNYDSHLPLLLQILLRLFVEEGELLQAGWDALSTMMKTVPEERQAKHIAFVRSVISDLSYDPYEHKRRVEVAGFCLKNGIAPLLPMFQYGLMHGSAAVRVDAADGLSDLINLTSEAALGPFVIKMTGPLIRIVGDRFPAEVKSAILHTLYLLICKCARHLKPFLPQLQTTFMKSLSDPSAIVRSRGAQALAELIAEPKRATTVLTELTTSVSGDANASIKTTMLQAMVGIVSNKLIGPQLAPEVVVKITAIAVEGTKAEKDSVRRESARLLSVLSPFILDADFVSLVSTHLLRSSFSNWRETDGALMSIQAIGKIDGARFDLAGRPAVLQFCLAFLTKSNVHVNVMSASILALGELMLYAARTTDGETVVTIAKSLAPFILSDVAQVRQDTATRFQLLGETSVVASILVHEFIVPNLLSRSIDSNGPVRTAIIGAMHTLFQFQGEFDVAEKLLGAYHAKMSKKDAGAATALVIFVKKSVAKTKISEVKDELWANQQGESLHDPTAQTADEEGEEDEEDEDEE